MAVVDTIRGKFACRIEPRSCTALMDGRDDIDRMVERRMGHQGLMAKSKVARAPCVGFGGMPGSHEELTLEELPPSTKGGRSDVSWTIDEPLRLRQRSTHATQRVASLAPGCDLTPAPGDRPCKLSLISYNLAA